MMKSLSGSLQSLQSQTVLFSHSIPSSSQKRFLRRKKVATVAGLQSDGGGNVHRRDILLFGVSVLPVLELRADAIEGRGARRGVRNLEEVRRRAQSERDKQDIEVPIDQVPKEVLQDVSSKDPEAVQYESKVTRWLNLHLNESNQESASGSMRQALESKDSTLFDGETLKKTAEKALSQQIAVQQVPQTASGNSLLSIVNVLGIIGSGVFVALYATSLREKAEMESAIETIKRKLNEEERAAALLKEEYETKLLMEQDDKLKQIGRLKEKEASLSGQLATANGALAGLRDELRSEQRLLGELKVQKTQLEIDLSQTCESKKMLELKLKEKLGTIDVLQDRLSLLTLEINDKENTIESLKLSLSEKESECKSLTSIIDQTKEALAEAKSIVESLKQDKSKMNEELNTKNASISKLDRDVKLLETENVETSRRINDLLKEFEDLKSSTDKKIAEGSALLSEKSKKTQELEEEIAHASKAATSTQAVLAELTKERDDLKARLEMEVNRAMLLKDEVQTAQEALGASRTEASTLSKELEVVSRSRKELETKLLKLEGDFCEAKKSLSDELAKAKSTLRLLSEELASMRVVLKSTKEELDSTTKELDAVMDERERFKKELVDIYKKAETLTNELTEERNIVATLKRELEVLGNQSQKDSEARRALEADLDEATKSLDEMNKSALLLSKELEHIYSRTSSLEAEKEVLYRALMEQKDFTKEAQENLEDAQNLISRLGSERDGLAKRSLKLEEEMASAKGEILKLRRAVSTSKQSTNEHRHSSNEVPSGTPFTAKKTETKRRKAGPASNS